MPPSILLLLPALFFSLVLLMVPYGCIMNPTSTTLACWGVNGRNWSAINQTLPRILPGVCVPDETFSSCGVYPDSRDMCGGSRVICMRSNSNTSTTDSCPFSAIIELPHTLSKTISETLDKWWLVYAFSAIIELPRTLSKTISETLDKWWLVYAFFGIVLFAIVCTYGLYVCMKCLKLRWCRVPESSASPQQESDLLVPSNPPVPSFPVMENVQVFTFKEIKKATLNFMMAYWIGSGGFGVVYSCRLSDGRPVAVKRCKTTGVHREAAFKVEVETLGKTRHVNVVSLIGYCAENNERICVFEFMENKDLACNLHPGIWRIRNRLLTSWKLRIKVLLDAARGIEYLHRYCKPQIIHRDIKSANILLDENWVAKISDFGLAVFEPEPGRDHVDIRAAGTIGYVDPDCYGDAPFVSQWTDVYSFGVVMLEMVTGRMAFNAGDNTHLVTFAAPRIATGRLTQVLDKRLSSPSGSKMEAVEMVAQLAQQCVSHGIQRPNMSVVVTELENAVARLDQQEAIFN